MERGEKLPQLATLIRLAVALECKLTALVKVFDKENLTELLPQWVRLAAYRLRRFSASALEREARVWPNLATAEWRLAE
jgi:hypothetical protein